jgi:predicted amidohydrolase YtcJ
MKRIRLTTALLLATSTAQAACYADYKAKQDNPLRLHYGVIELPQSQCTPGQAATALRQRLGDGWKLLQVMGVFDDNGLNERRASAGAFFLRY